MTFEERLENLREAEWDLEEDEGEIRLAQIGAERVEEISAMEPVAAAVALREILNPR